MIRFLSIDEVLDLYADSLGRFGGTYGLRDLALLESALGQPILLQQYDKHDIFELAAIYCFGIIKNHPFTDGNKRAGLLAAITFLYNNGIEIECNFEDLYRLALGIADSSIKLPEITKFLHNAATIK